MAGCGGVRGSVLRYTMHAGICVISVPVVHDLMELSSFVHGNAFVGRIGIRMLGPAPSGSNEI